MPDQTLPATIEWSPAAYPVMAELKKSHASPLPRLLTRCPVECARGEDTHGHVKHTGLLVRGLQAQRWCTATHSTPGVLLALILLTITWEQGKRGRERNREKGKTRGMKAALPKWVVLLLLIFVYCLF